MEFSRDELIIMMLYSPGDRPGLISTLEDMKGQLTGEDKELLNLICSILPKLEAMSHRVPLGTDARGNLIRLDNALAGIPERLESAKEQLANLQNQQEATKAELGKPFPQEAELVAKSQRLAELDAALNMEDTVESHEERSCSDRPSVLADLKEKSESIPPANRHTDYHEEVL